MSSKSVAITALVALALGFCIGFIPEHLKVTHAEDQVAAIKQDKAGVDGTLSHIHNQLRLSNFAVEAGTVYADAEQHNYAVAGSGASELFTHLRQYADKTQNQDIRQSLNEALSVRDRAIAGLARADASVTPLLRQVFEKLRAIQMQAAKQG